MTPPFRVGYPEGWFNRTARAKRHAVVSDEFSTLGHPIHRAAVCGAEVSVSQTAFTDTEASATTCSRCANHVAKAVSA